MEKEKFFPGDLKVPDRIIIGECRDKECIEEIIKAMVDGCPGSMTTFHCANPDAVVKKLVDRLKNERLLGRI